MSFFGQLLAGATAGGAGGYIKDREDEERAAAQLELKRSQYDQARLMQEDRQAFSREMALDRASRSSGSSSGGGGDDPLFGMLRAAKTPEEQDRALGYIRSLAGDDAAMRVSENVFGRLPTKERQYETIDALGDGTAGGTTSVAERASYDRDQGQKELQRFYALIANKGQTKSHAEGEALYFGNDARTAAVTQELKRGKSLVEATDVGARVADPEAYDRNQANRERITASVTNAQTRANTTSDTADLKGRASLIKDIEGQIVDLLKITGDEMRYNDEARKQAAEMLPLKRAELAELKRNGGTTSAGAPKPTANWTATGGTPRPAGKVPTLDELRAKHSR